MLDQKEFMGNNRGSFILDEKRNVIPCPDLHEWGRWMQDSGEKRKVRKTVIGTTLISTVFLGLDHSFCLDTDGSTANHQPIIFETMIFGGKNGGYQTRCCTWAQAEEMHEKALHIVKVELSSWKQFFPWVRKNKIAIREE